MMGATCLTFTGPKSVTVESASVPDPGADELLIRTRFSGISPGTELLIYRDQAPDELTADETIDVIAGSLQYPLQYGYSIVGDVVATGSAVSDEWLDRLVFAFHPHASHATLRPEAVYPVPDRIPADRATMLPTVETAVNFLMDAAPTVGERAVVFGQGPVGLLTTALLAEYPLDSVSTVEPLPARRDRSLSMGADRVFEPDALDPLRTDETGGGSAGVDVTFELSGNPDALDNALAVTGYAGRILIGSWYGERPASLHLGGRFHRSRIRLLSSQVSTLDPAHRGRWTKDRRIDVAWDRLAMDDFDSLITHRIPIDEADRAYRLLDERPNEAIQIVLTYE